MTGAEVSTVGRSNSSARPAARWTMTEAAMAQLVRRRLAVCIRPDAPNTFAVGGAGGAAISWRNSDRAGASQPRGGKR